MLNPTTPPKASYQRALRFLFRVSSRLRFGIGESAADKRRRRNARKAERLKVASALRAGGICIQCNHSRRVLP